MDPPIPVSETMATKQEIELLIPVSAVGIIGEEIEPPAPILMDL